MATLDNPYYAYRRAGSGDSDWTLTEVTDGSFPESFTGSPETDYEVKTKVWSPSAFISTPAQPTNPFITQGLTYLTNNAKAAWDFTGITGNPYDNAPASLPDFTGNGFGLNNNAGALTPKLGVAVEGAITHSFISIYTPSGINNGYFSDLPATNLYNSDFEIHTLFKVGDGNPAADYSIWGLNDGAAKRFLVFITATGTIKIQINLNGAVQSFIETDNPVFSNNSSNLTYLRLVCDFTNDVVKIIVNGEDLAVTVTGSAISNINPANFNSGLTGSAIGTSMRSATAFSFNQNSYCGVFKAAVTPILSNENNLKVGAWMSAL